MTNVFVGNLSYQTTPEELEAAFAEFGTVERVSLVRDRDTGQSRGFAFVEMVQDDDAAKAIAALNGKDFGGRALTINEARPRPERSGGFRPGGGGFGGKRRGEHDSFRGSRSPREPRW